jgi:hypothetical protein
VGVAEGENKEKEFSCQQVFARAEVWFGGIEGGEEIDEDKEKPISYSYIPDTNLENARNVSIALHERQGKFLKFRLYFAGRWIMIAEVTFDSCEYASPAVLERRPNFPRVSLGSACDGQTARGNGPWINKTVYMNSEAPARPP